MRSKEAARQAPGRGGARHQEGGAETRPRSAWNVTGGRSPSPAGVRPLWERGRRRSPQSQARSGEKGQSLLTWLTELEPGAACRTHAAAAPMASSLPPATALPRLIEDLGCLSGPVGARAPGPGSHTSAGRAYFFGASRPSRNQGVPSPEFPEPSEKRSEEVFTLNSNKAEYTCRFGRS